MVFMTYRLVLDERRRSCERLAQRALRLVWQQRHVHERLVHFLIHYYFNQKSRVQKNKESKKKKTKQIKS